MWREVDLEPDDALYIAVIRRCGRWRNVDEVEFECMVGRGDATLEFALWLAPRQPLRRSITLRGVVPSGRSFRGYRKAPSSEPNPEGAVLDVVWPQLGCPFGSGFVHC